MPCEVRGNMIICARGRPPARECERPDCRRPGALRCDYPVADGKTCDRYVCHVHSRRIASETDYCWEHLELEHLGARA